MKLVEAAGAVVLRRSSGVIEVLAVHRPRYKDWSLPKGKLQLGETSPVAAVREVAEETGVRIRLQSPLDQTSYRISGSAQKTVSWWLATEIESSPIESVLSDFESEHHDSDSVPEVDEVCWVPVDRVPKVLSYADDHKLVAQAIEQPVTTSLIVVRHAKAINRNDWHGSDADRPLRPRGRVQSRQLVPLLAAYDVREIFTSPWLRCTATLQPYALHARLSPTAWSILNEDEGSDDPSGVASVMDQLRDQAVVDHLPIAVCGHRPVLPHMVAALDIPHRPLDTAECLIVHLSDTADIHAVEYHRPLT
jgi:8-oxo-(d)GTP phosphatase